MSDRTGPVAYGDPSMAATIERVTTLVEHFHRDLPFRAPEAVAEHQARLLNQVWTALLEGANSDEATESRVAGYRCDGCGLFMPEDGTWDEARAEGVVDPTGAEPACPLCPHPYTVNSQPVTAMFAPREVQHAAD